MEGEGGKDVGLTFYYKNGKKELPKSIYFLKKNLMNPVGKFIVPEWEI